jgi:hypothetical protein
MCLEINVKYMRFRISAAFNIHAYWYSSHPEASSMSTLKMIRTDLRDLKNNEINFGNDPALCGT